MMAFGFFALISANIAIAQIESVPDDVAELLRQVRAKGFRVSVHPEVLRSDREYWMQVYNDGKQLNDDTLRLAARLPNVWSLCLTNPDSGGAGLAAFHEVRSLESLDLSIGYDTPITKSLGDPGWKALGALTQLKNLNLWLPVTSVQLKNLIPLVNLEEVTIGRFSKEVEPVLREWLSKCPRLKNLTISESSLTGEFLAAMSEDCALEQLECRRCDFTDEAITSIGRLPHLKSLKISEIKSANQWGRLSQSKSLEVLRIFDCDLTDESIKEFATLSTLKELDLSKSRFVGMHLNEWAKLSNLEKLILSDTSIATDDFAKLKGLVAAKQIDVNRTKITPAEIREWSVLKQSVLVNALDTKVGSEFAREFTATHQNFRLMVGKSFGSLQQEYWSRGKRVFSPGEKDLMRLGTKDGK